MGSAARKPAQGSATFSATSPQNIYSHATSRSVNVPQTAPKDNKPSSRSSSSLSFLSLNEDLQVNMVCEACSANFTIFKRKNRCLDCSKLFCTNCIRKEPRKCCNTCHMFTGSKDRSQLMQFKVKDLRQYLAARDISTIACREKEELVDLVVQYLSSQGGGAFMVTVNTFDETDSKPETSQGQSRTQPHPTAAEVSGNVAQQNPEATQGDTDLGLTRNNWPDVSSTSASEAENSPVPEFPSPEEHHDNTTTTPEQPPQATVRHRASISDLTKIDDINDLTVRQLKEILTLNFINYKGCVERWELEERVKRLYNEKQDWKKKEQASSSVDTDTEATKTATCESEDDNLCKICMDSPIDCVLLECGHMITCTKCGKQLAECPMCRQYIVRALHVFRS